jgi:polysaccharide export outer membrane protein
MRFIQMAIALTACVSIAGCDPVPKQEGGLPTIQSSAVLSSQTETLSADQIHQVMDTSPNLAYVLGSNDVISQTVYSYPELSVPEVGTPSNSIGGALITSDGTVQLPLIGNIHLGGLTLYQARQAITTAYLPYIANPKVAIELVQAQSLSYYLLGAFTNPGIKYPVHELTLLEALALGGSVDIPNADLYEAYVAQGDVKLPVDLYALLVEGDLSQNVLLAPGDTIVVPTSANEQAFVFGAVGKPGSVPFLSGGLSLLQALSVAGLDLTNLTEAQLSRVHIIRARGRSAEFYIVDATQILKGNAGPFQLEPGDIVFVPPTGIATWNQVLNLLLPSLQTVAATLEPFVHINSYEQELSIAFSSTVATI